jgi:DNA polymerase III epsilon subunit-like protein
VERVRFPPPICCCLNIFSFAVIEEREREVNIKATKMVFILDTETSGRKGIPLWHPLNRLLQICILHEGSSDVFKHYIKYDDGFFITPESTKIHGISNSTIEAEGVSPKVALSNMLVWVKQRQSCSLPPEVIAHNASFDRNVLRVAMHRFMGLDFGKWAEEWDWIWYCTVTAARELLPEPGLELFPNEQPYSLGVLYNFYFKETPAGLHNAVEDVKALSRVYNELILPKLTTPEIKEKYRIGTPPDKHFRCALVKSVPGYKDDRTGKIAEYLCREFSQEGDRSGIVDFSNFIHPLGLLMLGHLVLYGKMRHMQKIRRKEAQGGGVGGKEECTWFDIARSVERVLREEIRIRSDSVIAELVARVCNCDVVDLLFHTAREDKTLQFFPTMRGEPISYLPLKVSDNEAQLLLSEHGWGTINEIIVAWLTTAAGEENEALFFQRVNGCLYKDHAIAPAVMKKTFTELVAYL